MIFIYSLVFVLLPGLAIPHLGKLTAQLSRDRISVDVVVTILCGNDSIECDRSVARVASWWMNSTCLDDDIGLSLYSDQDLESRWGKWRLFERACPGIHTYWRGNTTLSGLMDDHLHETGVTRADLGAQEAWSKENGLGYVGPRFEGPVIKLFVPLEPNLRRTWTMICDADMIRKWGFVQNISFVEAFAWAIRENSGTGFQLLLNQDAGLDAGGGWYSRWIRRLYLHFVRGAKIPKETWVYGNTGLVIMRRGLRSRELMIKAIRLLALKPPKWIRMDYPDQDAIFLAFANTTVALTKCLQQFPPKNGSAAPENAHIRGCVAGPGKLPFLVWHFGGPKADYVLKNFNWTAWTDECVANVRKLLGGAGLSGYGA
jgi:hypothetical protein